MDFSNRLSIGDKISEHKEISSEEEHKIIASSK
jgi:hypothetical protein